MSNEVTAGNLTATISDHLPPLIIAPNIFCNPSANKTNILKGTGQSLTMKTSF